MKEVNNIIKPASQVRERTQHTEEFEEACVRIMADIEKAAAAGAYHTLFSPCPHHLSNDIRSAFERPENSMNLVPGRQRRPESCSVFIFITSILSSSVRSDRISL